MTGEERNSKLEDRIQENWKVARLLKRYKI